MDILLSLLQDAFFAGMAAVGFAAVSVPPRRSFPPIIILAALGHGLRWYLMNHLGVDIVGASLLASTFIGFGSYIFGRWWVHPHDGTLYPCPIAHDPRDVLLQCRLELGTLCNTPQRACPCRAIHARVSDQLCNSPYGYLHAGSG